jgi:hypothetical protein
MLIRSRQTVGGLALPPANVATKECADLTTNKFVHERIREVALKSPDVKRPIAATVVASMNSMPASDSATVPAWHERGQHPSSGIGTSSTRRRHRCRRTDGDWTISQLSGPLSPIRRQQSGCPTNDNSDLVRSSSEIRFHHRHSVLRNVVRVAAAFVERE